MQKHAVFSLILPTAALVVLGLIALLSTGAYAEEGNGDPTFLLQKQSIWLVLGVLGAITAAMLDYHFWRKTWWVWFGSAIALLVLCFIPGIGVEVHGAHRWINLGFASFQPSELGKFSVICFLAFWYARHEEKVRTFKYGILYPGLIVAAVTGLILAEVDIGTTGLIGIVFIGMMFVAGGSYKYLFPLLLLLPAGVAGAIYMVPERVGRIMAFLDLEKYRETEGYQQVQALIALGSGGVSGLGLGDSRQKMSYLPFAHTDFIFPIIGEELGLVTTLLVVFLFLILFLSGCCIAMHSRDRFGLLLGFGVIFLITMQAAINIGVTTAVLPNKGFPLPLISYGGSNLVFSLLGIGILINIYRQGLPTNRQPTRNVLRAKIRHTPRL